VSSESARYTFTQGSRAEGCIVYDDDSKIHIHHDSCLARGQSSSYDLVRLMRFGELDKPEHMTLPVGERPSSKAMNEFAMSLPEVRIQLTPKPEEEFDDLGPLTAEESPPTATALAKRICDVLKTRTRPRWLIPNYIERGVIALLVGPRGSYKSFIALDWSARIAMQIPKGSDEAVYVVSAEGGDYDRRFKAWWLTFGDGRHIDDVPLYVVEQRINLSTKEGIETLRTDAARIGKKPVLWVWDTWSKLTASADENSNSEVKQIIGLIDNGLKRAFDSTVLVVCHVGHSDSGRVRGASALGADSEAEYIVKRDERSGAVSVTRERFKSSPELEPVHYKPESVDLGYPGEDGKPVTSLILREASPEEASGRAREPTGTKAKAVWRVLVDLSPDGAPVDVKAVLDAGVEAEAAPTEGRDRRREKVLGRLNNLAAAGFVFFSDAGTKVALSRTKVIPEAEFDETLDT
jgi:hypothetical protein